MLKSHLNIIYVFKLVTSRQNGKIERINRLMQYERKNHLRPSCENNIQKPMQERRMQYIRPYCIKGLLPGFCTYDVFTPSPFF